MPKKNKNWEAVLKLLGLSGLIFVIVLALVIPSSELFQGSLPLRPSASICQNISLSSIPTPIEANKGAIVVIKTEPTDWSGPFRVLSSDGIVKDNLGHEGSFIETNEKVVSFSGGEADTKITVQAIGDENTQCVGSLSVMPTITIGCTTLKIISNPSPLTSNQSAEITLQTAPENWDGTFLIEAESGKLLLAEVDDAAQGEKTETLLTTGRKILYGGGKVGEKISVKALGEGNEACLDQLVIQ